MNAEQRYWTLVNKRNDLMVSLEIMGSDPFYGRLANEYREALVNRIVSRSAELDSEIKAIKRHAHRKTDGLVLPKSKYPMPDGTTAIGLLAMPLDTERRVIKEMTNAMVRNCSEVTVKDSVMIDTCLIALNHNRYGSRSVILKDADKKAKAKYQVKHGTVKGYQTALALSGTMAARYK